MRVLSVDDLGLAHRGGTIHLAHLKNQERLAARAQSGCDQHPRSGGDLMADPIQAMLAAGVVPTDGLPATSRYRDVGTATYGDESDAITYFRRRLVPAPERHPSAALVQVREGDRRDTLAHAQLATRIFGGGWRTPTACSTRCDLEGPPGRWMRVTGPPRSDCRQAEPEPRGDGTEADDA